MKKISIVTGGSSGLGKELVRELVVRGRQVCIIARDDKKIKDAINEIGSNILGYSCDLCDEKAVHVVFADLSAKGYYVDYLYNCAGVGRFGIPEDMHIPQIQTVMNSNVIGLMCITYEACRAMSEGGTIINIASTAALKGNAKETAYCASKWAVRGFTEALKAYYKEKGNTIHVIGVYPGGIKTPFWSEECGMNANTSKFMDPAELAKIIVENSLEKNSLFVSDITIDRK
ncbi:MAG: SDR family NAD(P)-dependent oxidoreductase [Bacilli bacterium]|nr:SDR family NAD(P)-dependent oxidoreductase [Bacilli bacterium]